MGLACDIVLMGWNLYFSDELVIFELLQLSEYCSGAIRLASYSCNAKDFLFPYPSLAPCYASTAREVLLNRTIDFPVSKLFSS